MKKVLFLFAFFTTLVHAESSEAVSHFAIESESMEINHESVYGVTNSYSFITAEHQLYSDSQLLFYYGTKFGIVTEDHTAENGFGPETDNFGTVVEANMGLHYNLKEYQHLTLEGSRTQDDLHQQSESRLNMSYRYKF